MAEYRMIAGIIMFLVIVIAILGLISLDQPGASPTLPVGWPPTAPTWNTPSWAANSCTNIAGIDYIACTISWFFGQVVAGFIFISSAVGYLVNLFIGIMSFRINGLPPELDFINTAITLGTIVVLALLVFRLIRSVIPFVSGE